MSAALAEAVEPEVFEDAVFEDVKFSLGSCAYFEQGDELVVICRQTFEAIVGRARGEV